MHAITNISWGQSVMLLHGVVYILHQIYMLTECVFLPLSLRDLRISTSEKDVKLAQFIKEQFLSRVRLSTQVSELLRYTSSEVT